MEQSYTEYMRSMWATKEQEYQERKLELVEYIKRQIDLYVKHKIGEAVEAHYEGKLKLQRNHLVGKIDLYMKTLCKDDIAKMTAEEIYFRATEGE